MRTINFRMLNADEIECRVGTTTDKGVSLLLYKDARVDMRLLDEVVGCMNWKREHAVVNNNLYCTVSIYNEDTKEWVSKQDVGVESNTEKEKGQASDAFKRACFNWGIGRELYTAPFIWVNLSANEWRPNATGRKQPAIRFKVREIDYTEGKITHLVIVDDSGKERYTYGNKIATPKNKVSDDVLGDAALAVEATTTIAELQKVWMDASNDLQRDDRFKALVNKKKAELEK